MFKNVKRHFFRLQSNGHDEDFMIPGSISKSRRFGSEQGYHCNGIYPVGKVLSESGRYWRFGSEELNREGAPGLRDGCRLWKTKGYG